MWFDDDEPEEQGTDMARALARSQAVNEAAVEEHRQYFIEIHLADGALRTAGGDRAAAIAMLQAAIKELELPHE